MLQGALSLVTCDATTTQGGTGHWPEQLGEVFFFNHLWLPGLFLGFEFAF